MLYYSLPLFLLFVTLWSAQSALVDSGSSGHQVHLAIYKQQKIDQFFEQFLLLRRVLSEPDKFDSEEDREKETTRISTRLHNIQFLLQEEGIDVSKYSGTNSKIATLTTEQWDRLFTIFANINANIQSRSVSRSPVEIVKAKIHATERFQKGQKDRYLGSNQSAEKQFTKEVAVLTNVKLGVLNLLLDSINAQE